MDYQFKVGDTVRVKSGGPDMTIEAIAKHGFAATAENAKCVWFDGKKRCEGIFELHTLELVRN